MRKGEVLNKAIGTGGAKVIQDGDGVVSVKGLNILKVIGDAGAVFAVTQLGSNPDFPSKTHSEGATVFGDFETLTVTSGCVAGY